MPRMHLSPVLRQAQDARQYGTLSLLCVIFCPAGQKMTHKGLKLCHWHSGAIHCHVCDFPARSAGKSLQRAWYRSVGMNPTRSERNQIMQLRSAEWFEGRDELGPQNRAVLRTLGWSREFFAGKPV